jgi:hypothetical protein
MKKMKSLIIVLALLAFGVTGVMAATAATFGALQPIYPTSFEGITPDEYPGNFVSSDDDQVCYDMSALGYIGDVTAEMRGFKIDPPTAYNDGNIDVILSADKRYLAWAAEENATVLAFIIKGGPNYHVYDYVPQPETSDSWLVSPRTNNNRIPQISHYNVCYSVDGGTQGCTPGYWRNHYDRWLDYTAGQKFDDVFGVTYLGDTVTLGMAIDNPNLYGTFAFHAVAALLNSTGGVPNADDGATVDYPYTTDQVIAFVQAALGEDGDLEATKDLLAAANELGCPLSGTAACSPNNPAACLP